MKLSQLVDAFPAMQALGQIKLPAKIGFRVAKALSLARPEVALYEATRSTLMQGLGTLSEDGKFYVFEGDSGAEFAAQHKAMLNEEVEITLPVLTQEDLDSAVIEPAHLAALYGVLIQE